MTTCEVFSVPKDLPAGVEVGVLESSLNSQYINHVIRVNRDPAPACQELEGGDLVEIIFFSPKAKHSDIRTSVIDAAREKVVAEVNQFLKDESTLDQPGHVHGSMIWVTYVLLCMIFGFFFGVLGYLSKF